tara:strand:+ start:779 stop:1090 length:312 start_codon:yes stop_codon:yes gene_type:complete
MYDPPGISNPFKPKGFDSQGMGDLQPFPQKISIEITLCIGRHDPYGDLGPAMVETPADRFAIGGQNDYLVAIAESWGKGLEHAPEDPGMRFESFLSLQFQRRN